MTQRFAGYIKQLHQWGYIECIHLFNPAIGSKVSCISFEKGGGNTNDKDLYKNANITYGNKQVYPINLKNRRERI